MLRIAFAYPVLILGLALVEGVPAAEPIAADQFEELHTLIKPQTDERGWEKIPWMTDLWEARRRAAELGRPILLWEMDGHPLGCV